MEHETVDRRPHAILLVDPDAQLLSELSARLGEELVDVVVHSAPSIECAGAELDSVEFDVVVVDALLPRSGHAAFLKEMQCRDHAPSVVFLAPRPDPELVLALHNAGSDRVLLKDSTLPPLLGRELRALLRARQAEQAHLKIQAQLHEANQLLREKNKRLDEFSATVAHDIRGPLGGISMKLEFILDVYKDEIDDRFQGLLKRALDASSRLTDIVQAMYEFAKLGAKAARMTTLDLGRLVNEVVTDLPNADSREVTVKIHALPEVWGSPDLLRRVFGNLIGNAIKYNDKSEVEIEITQGRHVDRPLGRFVEVRVHDNGPGIEVADQPEMFSLFRRGLAASGSSEGLGVGLAVVQRIVELHYGSVAIESVPGEGCTFVLSLPLERLAFEPGA